MPIVTQLYPALAQVVHTAFYTQSIKGTEDWREFAAYQTKKDMRPIVAEQTFAPVGLFVEKPQLKLVNYDQPEQAYKSVYTFATWGLGVVCSKELIMEDQYGIIPSIPSLLRYSAGITRCKKVWNIFNQATTSTVTGADGVSLANSAHPMAKLGPNISNTQGTAAISPTTLQSMFLNFQVYKDDAGVEDFRTPRVLWVPPQLEQVAIEIVGTGPKAPYTTNNTINIMHQRVEVKVSRFITSTTAFALVGEKPPDIDERDDSTQIDFAKDCHQIKYFEEWPDNLTVWDHPPSLGLEIIGDFRGAFGWTDFRAFEFSSGQ